LSSVAIGQQKTFTAEDVMTIFLTANLTIDEEETLVDNLFFDANDLVLTNFGTLSGSIASNGALRCVVDNQGLIDAFGSAISLGFGADFVVTNAGEIRATGDNGALGVGGRLVLTNSGDIIVSGGAAFFDQTIGVLLTNEGVTHNWLDNSGLISATAAGDALAYAVLAAAAIENGIVNHGTIIAEAANGVSYGIMVSSNFPTVVSAPNIINTGDITADFAIVGQSTATPEQAAMEWVSNEGTINGAIQLNLGDDRIDNSNTINGDVDMGGGADIVDTSGGTINGVVSLGADDDQFIGGAGADAVNGDAGADILNGGDGDDTLNGGAGADQLNGGAGFDTVDYSTSVAAVRINLGSGLGLDSDAQGDNYTNIEAAIGSAFDDRFTGAALAETFSGGAGADTALGQNGADALHGEAGNDSLNGGAGNDLLTGGDNDDVLVGGTGADQLIGGAGVDSADYSASNGAVRVNLAVSQGLDFHAHGDTYNGIEIVIGSNFADRFTGSANGDTFRAGAGADVLLGQNGDDVLDGGAGADNLNGGNQNDILIGGAGGDVLAGGTGIDTIDYSASAGGVRVNISANLGLDNDAQGDTFNSVEGVIGSAFNDRFTGATQFADFFHGAGGDDTLLGQAGDDFLYGETGNDTITGGAGSDLLDGGLGADAFNGGAGLDAFVFADVLGAGNVDTIAGFSVADDVIHLSTAIFGVAAGTLAASAFTIGAAAADADDRIIYNSATGAVFFDADGDGAGAAVQFATLGTGLALTNADFFGFGS
jgi:Ca2+-binding RTX toxin-like protein